MTDTAAEPSLEDRCWNAAVERYKSLDSHMFIELSGRMPHKDLRAASDAAVALVRRELTSTYAALLEANAARDEARALAYNLKSALDLAVIGTDTIAACGVDLDALPDWLTGNAT